MVLANILRTDRAAHRSLPAGRQRGIDAEVDRLHHAVRLPQMRQLPLAEQAMSHQALALLRQLDAARTSVDDLAAATVESFDTHPDTEIITSFPRLGSLTAPGCSPRSVTTDPASPTRKDSRTSPGPLQ
jgi:hypothetical protein